MENQITLEQALQNITIVCEKYFVGKREEHLILEQCLKIIHEEIEKNKRKEQAV